MKEEFTPGLPSPHTPPDADLENSEISVFKDNLSEIQAEHLYLGGILQKPEYLMETEIQAKHFVSGHNQIIFDTIREVDMSGEPVDPFIVGERIEEKTGKNYQIIIADCVQASFTEYFMINAESVMKRNYKRREVMKVVTQLKHDYDIDTAIKGLMNIESIEKKHLYSMKEAVSAALDKAQETAAADGMSGLPTSIKKLDDILGGLNAPDLIILAGRPAMGKTSVALNWMLAHDAPSMFFSTEQPHYQIGQRAISKVSHVSAQKIRVASFNDHEMSGMTAAVMQLQRSDIKIYDQGSLSITELVREARKAKFNFNIQAVYVDYVQRMVTPGDRREGLGEILRGLKSLAKELHIPVVALAQVNREVEKRTDKRPYMADLKDSGDFEQEADEIIFCYRDEVYHESTPDVGIMELIIEKNRHGPTGTVRTSWLADTMSVENLSYAEENY